MASCTGVDCVSHATCAVLPTGYTCRCDTGYEGNGFQKCVFAEHLDEKYILIIVLIILLFVGLAAIVVFIMCRRKLSEKPMRQPLVGTTELSPYEMKWQVTGGQVFKQQSGKLEDKQDGPPPYNVMDEKKQVPSDDTLTSFQPVEAGRVPVHDDDGVDEKDAVRDYDNPSYSTITEARGTDISEEVKTNDYKPEEEEAMPSYTNPVFEKSLESIPAEVGETERRSKTENAIAVTFTEGDEPYTVAAHITTPDANLTINLNITIPDQTVVPIKTVE